MFEKIFAMITSENEAVRKMAIAQLENFGIRDLTFAQIRPENFGEYSEQVRGAAQASGTEVHAISATLDGRRVMALFLMAAKG